MDKERLKRNLEYTKKKHENDKLDTFDTDISMLCFDTLNVLDNCIEIPNGATNGDVLKVVFDAVEKERFNDDGVNLVVVAMGGGIKYFDLGWFDAPYRNEVMV
jgi:hypothetical protein